MQSFVDIIDDLKEKVWWEGDGRGWCSFTDGLGQKPRRG